MSGQQTLLEYGMPVHPVCEIVPLMSEEALARLVDDIRENGLRVPLITHEGMLVDGRNRLIACTRAGVTPRFEPWDGRGSLARFAWSMNGERRDLTPDQRALAAVLMLPILEQEAAERQKQGRGSDGSGGRGHKKNPTQKVEYGLDRNKRTAAAEAAAITGANRQYVAEAKRMQKENPEEFEKLKKGDTTIAKAKAKNPRKPSKPSKPVSANPANAEKALQRFLKTHFGYIDDCIQACAQKQGPISLAEIATITGLSKHNIEKNSVEQYWGLCSWLEIRHFPDRMIMYEANATYRAIFEGRGPKLSPQAASKFAALGDLRREIDRRRNAAKARRAGGKWNPEIAHTVKLVELLDYIEMELDKLSQ